MLEARRLKLHEELCEILGNEQVYYQPPASLEMRYPCIKYSRTGLDARHANDRVYKVRCKYELIVIDPDVTSDIPNKVLHHFQSCSFDREYPSNNLNHVVFTLYY